MQEWIEDKLIGRAPLDVAVPRLGELLRDPRAALAADPIEIEEARPYLLLALGSGGVPLLAWYFAGEAALRVGVVLGLVLLAAALIRLRRSRLVLSTRGVALHQGDAVVTLPWALFVSPGVPVAGVHGSVAVPVDPRAVPLAQLHRRGALVAQGAGIKLGLVKLDAAELHLPMGFRARGVELAELLRQLAPRLSEAPTFPAWSGPSVEAPGSAPEEVGGGWLHVRLTRLVFPPFCCACEAPTESWLEVRAPVRFGWLLRIAGGDLSVAVSVPHCDACFDRIRARRRKCAALGLAAGLGAGALGLLSDLDSFGKVGLFVVGGVLGPIFGWVAAEWIRLPVAFRKYSPSRGTAELLLRRASYRLRFVAAMSAAGESR